MGSIAMQILRLLNMIHLVMRFGQLDIMRLDLEMRTVEVWQWIKMAIYLFPAIQMTIMVL